MLSFKQSFQYIALEEASFHVLRRLKQPYGEWRQWVAP